MSATGSLDGLHTITTMPRVTDSTDKITRPRLRRTRRMDGRTDGQLGGGFGWSSNDLLLSRWLARSFILTSTQSVSQSAASQQQQLLLLPPRDDESFVERKRKKGENERESLIIIRASKSGTRHTHTLVPSSLCSRRSRWGLHKEREKEREEGHPSLQYFLSLLSGVVNQAHSSTTTRSKSYETHTEREEVVKWTFAWRRLTLGVGVHIMMRSSGKSPRLSTRLDTKTLPYCTALHCTAQLILWRFMQSY